MSESQLIEAVRAALDAETASLRARPDVAARARSGARRRRVVRGVLATVPAVGLVASLAIVAIGGGHHRPAPKAATQRAQTAAYIVQHAAAAEAGAARMIQVTTDRAGVDYMSVATQQTVFVSSRRTSHGWPLLASAEYIKGTTYTNMDVDYKDRAYTVNSASTLDGGPWGAKGIVIGSWLPGVTASDPASAYTAALRKGIIKVIGYRNLDGRQTILIQIDYQKVKDQNAPTAQICPAGHAGAPSSSGSASSGPPLTPCEPLPPGTVTCKRVPLGVDEVWLDASTYLEVQEATIAPKTVGGSASEGPGVRPTCAKVVGWSTTTTSVDWLPPTKHNLALLNLTPPAGFTQVSNQQMGQYLGPYS